MYTYGNKPIDSIEHYQHNTAATPEEAKERKKWLIGLGIAILALLIIFFLCCKKKQTQKFGFKFY